MDRIKNWCRSVGSKMQSFMYGRYGYDELSQFLSKTALLCVIVPIPITAHKAAKKANIFA